MKNAKILLSASLAVLAMLFSCQKEEFNQDPTGVEFTLFSGTVNSSSARIHEDGPIVVDPGKCDINLAAYAKVYIEDVGEFKLPIKKWGNDYRTNLVELAPKNGPYKITSFVCYDKDDNALFATPAQGSLFQHFVDANYLIPREFSISAYKKLNCDMQVLCIEKYTPPQFGFHSWNIDLRSTMNLCIFANYCEPTSGHSVAKLEARVYPDDEHTSDADLIWYGENVLDDDDPENDILCLKFPYDPDETLASQSFYVVLNVQGMTYTGTINLQFVDDINKSAKGYLHLNEDCQGCFYPFSVNFMTAWEDLVTDNSNDMDYNDFIVRTVVSSNRACDQLIFDFEPIARGAGFNHAYKMMLPGVGYVVEGGAVVEEGGNTIVTVYENTRLAAFGKSDDNINTTCGGTTAVGIPKTIKLSNLPNDFTYYLGSPFEANFVVKPNGAPYYVLAFGAENRSTFIKNGTEYYNGIITPWDWCWPLEGKNIIPIYGEDVVKVSEVPTWGIEVGQYNNTYCKCLLPQ